MERKDYLLVNRFFTDLNPLLIGTEVCTPGHTFGPYTRDYTLIHFIKRGCGVLLCRGREYPVHAGEAFLILPGEITTYRADLKDPWEYAWVGFDGALTPRFSELPPVFSFTRNWPEEMILQYETSGTLEYGLASTLFLMYADLFLSAKPSNHYVRRVADYIHALYMQDLRVEQIARDMNLDRRYLTRLFKEKTGKTVQEYLIATRLEAAKRLLEEGRSVGEAAALSGYSDVCNFSKMFRRTYGTSPGRFRSKERNN